LRVENFGEKFSPIKIFVEKLYAPQKILAGRIIVEIFQL